MAGKIIPNAAAPKSKKVKLSPLMRIMMSFEHELSLDKNGLFNEKKYEGYLKQFQVAEQKRDLMLRNLIVIDVLVVLVVLGKEIAVPGTGLSLGQIPSAREVLTFFASMSAMFAAAAHINWHGYSSIIDQFHIRAGVESAIDPDFLSASDKFLEFPVKLYRAKFNIWSADFFEAGGGYVFISAVIMFIFITLIIAFLALHFVVIGYSVWATVGAAPNSFLKFAYLLFVAAANSCAFLMIATVEKKFVFTVRASD